MNWFEHIEQGRTLCFSVRFAQCATMSVSREFSCRRRRHRHRHCHTNNKLNCHRCRRRSSSTIINPWCTTYSMVHTACGCVYQPKQNNCVMRMTIFLWSIDPMEIISDFHLQNKIQFNYSMCEVVCRAQSPWTNTTLFDEWMLFLCINFGPKLDLSTLNQTKWMLKLNLMTNSSRPGRIKCTMAAIKERPQSNGRTWKKWKIIYSCLHFGIHFALCCCVDRELASIYMCIGECRATVDREDGKLPVLCRKYFCRRVACVWVCGVRSSRIYLLFG